MQKTKTIKTIHINTDACNGCRACEAICSAFHSEPRYSSSNPERSRIRVYFDPLKNIYIPIMAGEYTPAECNSRYTYTIDGSTYCECAFCRASCPARTTFKDPDSGLPLKCDVCEEDPSQPEPLCVQWCFTDALTYEEREEVVEEEDEIEKQDELEIGLESLADKHGLQKVRDTLDQISYRAEAD